jgi:hypothetical protein
MFLNNPLIWIVIHNRDPNIYKTTLFWIATINRDPNICKIPPSQMAVFPARPPAAARRRRPPRLERVKHPLTYSGYSILLFQQQGQGWRTRA